MKKIILKMFGVDINYYAEIKKYNAAKQKEDDIIEFKSLEAKIKYYMGVYKDVCTCLRKVTEDGFPTQRYRELSQKYKLYEDEVYKNL